MNKYIYYKGEEVCPYATGSEKAYFFGQESRHATLKKNNPAFIEKLTEIFHKDYEELHSLFTDDFTWEVICVCLDNEYMCGWHEPKKQLEKIKKYGRNL